MKEKTKDNVVGVGATVLTIGTSSLVSLLAGYGGVALVNHVLKGQFTKGSAAMLGGIILTGSIGLGMLTTEKVFDQYIGIMQDIMDKFPTTKEVKEENG